MRRAAAAVRRRRAPLSREDILVAGLRVARRDDLRRLTMQRLGSELGVSAMAVYRHYRNKREIVDAILEHFAREADVIGHGCDPADWRVWLQRTFHAMYEALVETPGVLPYLAPGTSWRFGRAALSALDETLAVLQGAGFEAREAAEIYATCLAMAVGCASLAAARSVDADDAPLPAGERRRRLRSRISDEAGARHPNVARAAGALASTLLSPGFFDTSLARYLGSLASPSGS